MFLNNFIKVFLFVASLCLFIYFLFQIREKNLDKRWEKTEKDRVVGKVIDFGYSGKGNRYAVLEYIVNDNVFLTNISGYSVLNELFNVTYDVNNPSNCKVTSDCIISIENDEVGHAIGKLISHKGIPVNKYFYEYWFNHKKYIHFYYPAENSKVLYPNVKIGQLFKVKFLTSNPRRSKILFDEPIEYYSEWWTYKYNETKGFYKE